MVAKGRLWCSHPPLCGIHSDGSGLTEVTVEKCPPPSPICSGHWDGLVSRVCPVDVLVDPVNGQSLGGVELAVDQDLLLGRVTRFVNVGAAGTGGHRAPTGLPQGSQGLPRAPRAGPRAAWLAQEPLWCSCSLLLSPTASYFLVPIRQHFHNRELFISLFYLLPNITTQFRKTFDFRHVNFNSIDLWDLWTLKT